MRLPRDVSGDELSRRLRSYGYKPTRQTGSHLRLTSMSQGSEHHVKGPRHDALRVGTLSAILADVASYLGVERDELMRQLFAR